MRDAACAAEVFTLNYIHSHTNRKLVLGSAPLYSKLCTKYSEPAWPEGTSPISSRLTDLWRKNVSRVTHAGRLSLLRQTLACRVFTYKGSSTAASDHVRCT